MQNLELKPCKKCNVNPWPNISGYYFCPHCNPEKKKDIWVTGSVAQLMTEPFAGYQQAFLAIRKMAKEWNDTQEKEG